MSVDAPTARPGRGKDLAIAAAIAGATLALLVATGPDYGMVWDEGHTVRRERVLGRWFAWVADPPEGHTRGEAFARDALALGWPFGREEPDGHPPFYAHLGLAGWRATRGALDPLSAYRFGPMALAVLTAGAAYLHLARRRGRTAGLVGAGLFVLMPRLFTHAHYAHYDMPMTCLWLLAQMAFVEALGSRRWIAPFGLAWGLAAATKFTGWFVPVAPAAWVLLVEGPPLLRRLVGGRSAGPWPSVPGLRALMIGGVVAAAVLVAIQPAWWADPPGSLMRFLESNLTRDRTKPIPTYYLGRAYPFGLPWHNTLVLIGATTPALVVVLGAVGVASAVARRRAEPWALIWPLSFAVLMVVRALPGAPGHDGVRLLLPAPASLAILAGLGTAWIADRLRPRRLAWAAALLGGAAVGESVVGIVQTYPYTDSYFSAAIGGLPGAERLGLELTSYWDTMGPEFLAWARAETARRPLALRFPSPLVNVPFLREWGALPPASTVPILDFEPVERPDYVVQRRQGVYYPYDWWLERRGRPHFVVRRQGVDLLRVYPYDESRRAYEATKDLPIPAHLRN